VCPQPAGLDLVAQGGGREAQPDGSLRQGQHSADQFNRVPQRAELSRTGGTESFATNLTAGRGDGPLDGRACHRYSAAGRPDATP
jgi:hypothetical protein